MSKKNQPSALESALTVFAGEFTDYQEKIDQDGQIIRYNGMAYVQRRMLNGICYTAEKLLEEQHDQLITAGKKLDRLIRSNMGDEIGTKQVEDQTRWVKRLQLQIAVVSATLDHAKAVHERELGEAYVPYKQRTKPQINAGAEQSDTMRAALAALEEIRATAPKSDAIRVN
jgi:hypothetical protein